MSAPPPLCRRYWMRNSPIWSSSPGMLSAGIATRCPEAAWRMAAAPLVARGLPWCAVFGNHDDECGVSRRQLLAIQQKIPGCLTRTGPCRVSGLGNFLLRFVQAKGADRWRRSAASTPTATRKPTSVAMAGFARTRVHWFSQSLHRLTASPASITASVLVFLHIPLPEYDEVWQPGQLPGGEK